MTKKSTDKEALLQKEDPLPPEETGEKTEIIATQAPQKFIPQAFQFKTQGFRGNNGFQSYNNPSSKQRPGRAAARGR